MQPLPPLNDMINPTLDEPILIFGVVSLDSPDAHIVRLNALIGEDSFVFTGTSRRHPEDKPNKEIGELLASARAYDALSRKIAKRAKGLIAQQDHNRALKPIQAAAKEKFFAQKTKELKSGPTEENRILVNPRRTPRRSRSAQEVVVTSPD